MKSISQEEEHHAFADVCTCTSGTFFEVSSSNNDIQFTKIVHAHSSRLFYLAYQITKNRQVSEDIVQDAFLRLWQDRIKIIPGNPGGWLCKVVSNLGYKHVKRTSLQLQIFNSLRSTTNNYYADIEECLIKKENEKLFNNVFNRLPQQQQVVYQLSREKGLRRNEIASQMNLSPNTVKVHLARAVRFMKEHVAFLALFILFFVFNNLFFRSSNPFSGFRDLYKTRYQIEKGLPKKMVTLNLSDRSDFAKK